MSGLLDVRADVLSWLLEPDADNPGVRYHALCNLLGKPAADPEVRRAKADVMRSGPVPVILDAQYPEGYWVKPGGGLSPSYRSTFWQVLFLAELGADPDDKRVQRGCDYLLNHYIAANGAFALSRRPVPSSVVHCFNGDSLYALVRLGYADDPRVQSALDWQVRSIIGEEEIRFYRSGTSGPRFACGYNERQPCAWGATKALRALVAVPAENRTAGMERALQAGAEFLLSRDPAVADYPYSERVNSAWFKFGFPLSYRSDVLETAQVLVAMGYGQDPRLAHALQFIAEKQDERGRWTMETSLNGKMWADIEAKGKSSKWVTLRALQVLHSAGVYQLSALA